MSSRALRPCLAAGCASLLALAGLALAPARAHRPVPIEGPRGRYIVTLNPGVADPAGAARRQIVRAGGTVDRVYGSAMKGYSASLPQALLSQLLGDPAIASVEPDVEVQLAATQVNPPTNLDRIDQRDLPLSRTFSYSGAGTGVRAYVIDTGTRADLPEFQGRVTAGYNVFTGRADAGDCNGHGTHVAGILASATYGVAKNATIVPVKAFGCANTTTLSAIVAAVDWATADHRPGQPAVANLSFAVAAQSPALNRAVAALSADGVAVAAAAGNEASDACASSPSSLPQVLSVGASDGNDRRARFSNGGPCVDLFAPGVAVVSTDFRSLGTSVISGTSMAAPHVTGALAREVEIPGTSSQEAQARVLAKATTGKIIGVDPRCVLLTLGCQPGTANRLLFV